MNFMTKTAVSVAVGLCSSSVFAAHVVADARGNAMGNTGVASANYLTAPFYNPALGSSFRDHDNFGLLLPAVGVNASDQDDVISTIDDLDDAIDNNNSTDVHKLLDKLDGSQPLNVTAGLGIAIALPTHAVSTNFFARGYVEVMSQVNVDNSSNAEDRYDNSEVDTKAFGYSEYGVSFSKAFVIANQDVSFGISPKYQQMKTYTKMTTLEDFDFDDYEESENSAGAFNFDLGAVWYRNNFRAALAIKDVLAQEIELKNNQGTVLDTYELNPQATIGLAYTNRFFTAAFDADLTKQTRFKSMDDDTQFVRVGLEGNAWGWAQLRAGYEIDLQDTLDNSLTAGVGLSPWDVVHLDIAASYAGENQFGAAANLYLTF
ncbi:conjugal transfer protein TraF [Vibrio sp. 10N.286.49.B3]|uniref:conjugal transfer protein TraF n=1 Tax=Vibrio sp. 10N.286.49.B3 TaxID=1880855 RepID=UPI001F5364B7|nr:conjugal transfer protein TraF [Vibrio sp. 10N.286.49.B3]